MIIYVLKFSACLGILMIFYQFFLEKEHMHMFKRFYLLGAILIALLVPLVTFTEYVEVATATQKTTLEVQKFPSYNGVPKEALSDYLPMALWSMYLFGALLFGFQFLRNLIRILRRIRNNPKYRTKSTIKVLLWQPIVPHTFFKYVFLNKQRYEAKEIPEAVLLHEEIHALQKHSLDVLFIELLQVVFWFNPLVYRAKRAIKLNHEFLADQAVLQKGIPPSSYLNILLAYSSQVLSPLPLTIGMANSLNYSSIKKRMSVMKKQTSKKSIVLRSMLLLPLLALSLFGFSETKIVQKEATHAAETFDSKRVKSQIFEAPEQKGASKEQISEFNALAKKYNTQPQKSRVVPLNDLKTLEDIYRLMTPAQKENAQPFPECPSLQDGATEDQIKEYNSLIKKINSQPENRRTYKKKDVERLEYLYSVMSEKQKKKAQPYPKLPPPPQVPSATKSATRIAPVPSRSAHKHHDVEVAANTVAPEAPEAPEIEVLENEEVQEVDEVHEAPEMEEMDEVAPPDAPEPPMSPLDHVIEMAKEDASFYFEGKKISSDKAIDILKKNDEINIDINANDGKPPVVKLSKEPIEIDN